MTAPSGWYPDPHGAGQRYFDNSIGWTNALAIPLSDTERIDRLAAAVAYEGSQGARVQSQSVFAVVLVYGQQRNDIAWFLAGLFTCGIGWIGWLIAASIQFERRVTLRIDLYGNIIRS